MASSLTVGKIVTDLFPEGFRDQQYIELISHTFSMKWRDEKFVRDTVEFDQLRDDLTTEEKKLKETIEEEYQSRVGKAPSSTFRQYISLPFTPFDLFAVCATLLEKSGAHHHIEVESLGAQNTHLATRAITPSKHDREMWAEAGDEWRFNGATRDPRAAPNKRLPKLLVENWVVLLVNWDTPVFLPSSSDSEAPVWWHAALALLAISDRAARDAGFVTDLKRGTEKQSPRYAQLSSIPVGGVWTAFVARMINQDSVRLGGDAEFSGGAFSRDAFWNQSLSLAARDQAAVLPKSRTAQLGCTLRSLTHNLALLPARGSVRATWISQNQGHLDQNELERETFNLLIVPYPFTVQTKNFCPTRINKDKHRVGNFSYVSSADHNNTENVVNLVERLIAKCEERVGTVHGLVFPELALSALEFDNVYRYVLNNSKVELLCAGLNQHYPILQKGRLSKGDKFYPSNEAVMVSFGIASEPEVSGDEGKRKAVICAHRKHHRWKLTERQIIRYGLSSALDPSMTWWEDIRTTSRKLPFLVMRDQWTVTTLICEDLARTDPGQRVVRAIGPNLVLSLVMDGPQIPGRWSAMYATVLTDDPGCSVLTLSSLGLVDRSMKFDPSRRDGNAVASRSIAIWRDDVSGLVPIVLNKDEARGLNEEAACLTLYEHKHEELTLDARSDECHSTTLRLGNYITI